MRFLAALVLVGCRDGSAPATSEPATCAHVEWGGTDVSSALHVGPGQTFPTLEDALARAQSGDVVAIHDGTYLTDPIEVDVPGVRVVGRCRDTVRLASTGEGMRVTAPDVTVSGVTLADGFPQAITFSGADARMTHARVVDARGWGISSSAIDLTLEDVEVLRTRTVSEDSGIAIAVNVGGGRLDATGLLVDGSDGWGVYGNANLGTELVLRRSRVTNLWRFVAVSAASVVLEGGVEIDHVVGQAVSASRITSEGDVHVHDIGWSGAGQYELRRFALEGTRLTIGPGFVAEDIEAGVLVAGGSSCVEGAVIRDACTLTAGFGAVIANGSALALVDVEFSDVACSAVRGVNGASLTMERVRIDGARDAAIVATDSRLAVSDVQVADVRAGALYEGMALFAENATVSGSALRAEGTDDYGLVFAASSVDLAGVDVTRTTGAGVVALGSAVTLEGLDIRGVVPAASRRWGGFGVYVGALDGNGVAYAPTRGSTGVVISDGTIADATLAGVYAVDGVPLTLQDVTVTGTLAGPDATDARGDGLVLAGGSHLTATGLSTRGNARVGVLFDASTGTLVGGTLEETPGLVQQSCGASVTPVGMEGVEVPGGVVGCDADAGLIMSTSAPVWADDVSILE